MSTTNSKNSPLMQAIKKYNTAMSVKKQTAPPSSTASAASAASAERFGKYLQEQRNNSGEKNEKELPPFQRSKETNAFLKSIGLAGGKRKTMRRKSRKGRKHTRKH